MIHAVLSADEQLAFLRQLQRLLDEGSFVASYKYALLHAIADLCVLWPTSSFACTGSRSRRSRAPAPPIR
jgi:hypothetical protein